MTARVTLSLCKVTVGQNGITTSIHTMKTIRATFEVVTPMFLGAADQSPEGIRPSSVKGALRFWWRAWAWSGIAATCADDNAALQALHREETHLFGSAVQDKTGGQGLFMLHVRDCTRQATDRPFGSEFDSGILYLLGQGLGSFKGGNHCIRQAIPAGHGANTADFDVKLIFSRRATTHDQESILTALKLFGLLGALGSRARHGLGSVRLKSIETLGTTTWEAPLIAEEYTKQLCALMPPSLAERAPPLSALSKLTRIDLSLEHANPSTLLNRVGQEQQAYRSYGQSGKVNGKPSERNFVGDHDLALQVSQGERVRKAPDRIVFGLPHNYFFSSTKGKADVNYAPKSGEGRRASPLLFHVHKVGERYIGVHALLTAQFLPPPDHEQPAMIELKKSKNDGNGSSVSLPERDVKWTVLHDYLDRFHKEPFAGKTIYGKQ